MQDLESVQRLRNSETIHFWDSMAAHRKRVTEAVLSLGAANSSLCILGAGNCNDLDLAQLGRHFAAVHLFDIDDAAVRAGVLRQTPDAPTFFAHHAELSGIASSLTAGSPEAPSVQSLSKQRLSQLIDATNSARPLPSAAAFDVTVSACLLSQLLGFVGECIPSLELVLAVRNAHLALLLRHTLPSGNALLLCDMVSSTTLPALLTCADADLERLRDEAVRVSNFFHGTNPHAIVQQLSRLPECQSVSLGTPWRWHIGQRAFLVNPIRVQRSAR